MYRNIIIYLQFYNSVYYMWISVIYRKYSINYEKRGVDVDSVTLGYEFRSLKKINILPEFWRFQN